MKTCIKCGETKLLEDFPRKKGAMDGHRNYCIRCKTKADYEVRLRKFLSKPGSKEDESARRKTARDSLPEDEKLKRLEKAIARHRKNREVVAEQFFNEHGCTKKEFKRRQDEQEFISGSKALNGDKYDYSAVNYQGVYPEVTIFCNKHEQSFQQSPKSHKKGSGCPLCAKEQCGLYHKKGQEQFVQEAQEFCGDKYTFEHVEYVNYSTHVNVTCTTHGIFPIKPANLFNGRGCPSCAEYGYNKSKPGILYVLESDNIVKIGITNRTSGVRAKNISKSSGTPFKVLWDFWFDDGRIPADLETALLNELRLSYVQPTNVFDGSTECFQGIDTEWLLSKINKQVKETLNAYY